MRAAERIPHELPEKYPTESHLIESLTKTNREFGASLLRMTRSIDLSGASEHEATSDEVLETPKKRRLLLKDDLAAMLTKWERRT